MEQREDNKEIVNFDAYETILDDIVKSLHATLDSLYKLKESMGQKIESGEKQLRGIPLSF